MKSLKLAVIYGFLIWLIPFIVSVVIFPIHDTNRPLFESIMPVAGVASALFFLILYFRKVSGNYLQEGVRLGILWLAISLVIDLFMFLPSNSPMSMSLADYISDIGVTYLAIPTLTIGVGFLLERKTAKV
jgi:hypothetical protein